MKLYYGKDRYVDAEWLGSGSLHVRDADLGDSHSMGSGFDVGDGAAFFAHVFKERFEGVETLERTRAFAGRHGLELSKVSERPAAREERTFVGVERADLVHLACHEGEVRLYRIPMLADDPTETWVIPEPVSFLFALLLERYEGPRAYSALRQTVDHAGLTAKDGFRDY